MRRSSHYASNVNMVAEALRSKYGDFAHNNKKNPLSELLFIMCSTKTTGPSYQNTYRAFRRDFPKFIDIAEASESELSKSLSSGGLQNIKAKAIKHLILILKEHFGKPTLSPLKRVSDDECENFLISLPGVGKKVARCIMMYSLGRQVFPVDTHCWRICKRLGWVNSHNKGSCTSKDMDKLQEMIPPELRFSLHVNMVSLGREICVYHDPRCTKCPIGALCKKVDVRSKR